MTLPKVSVMAVPGEPPVVTVNGNPVAGVRTCQVTVSRDGVPQVSVTLAAEVVDVDVPAQVTVLRAGPSAAQFAAQVDARRLEADALAHDDVTMGEGFARALAEQAGEFDDCA